MKIWFFKTILLNTLILNSFIFCFKPLNMMYLRNEKKITNYVYNLSNSLTNNNTNCKCVLYGKSNNKIFQFYESFEYNNKESSYDIALNKINQIKYDNVSPMLLFYYIIFEATKNNYYNLIKIVFYNNNINILVENKEDELKIHNYLLFDKSFYDIEDIARLRVYNINDLR